MNLKDGDSDLNTKNPSTSPDLSQKFQIPDKKPNFINKNIEKLRKKSKDITISNIDITELIESESTPKSIKPLTRPTTKLNTRGQSLTRPIKKLDPKPKEDPKTIQKSLTGTSTTFYQKDTEIENLLKIDEYEGRQSPQISLTPNKNEEKANKRSSSKAPEGFNEITTSLKSQEFLANKFIKDFNSALIELDAGTDLIDLEKLTLFLEKLRFIKNDRLSKGHEEESAQVLKLWKMINGESTVKVQNLLSICLNIMNLYSPNGHSADSECTNLKSWSFMNGIFVYNSDEALKIHKMFYQFYQNRRLAPKKVTESLDLSQEYSFKPMINRNSRDLASEGKNRYGSLGSQKREEFLNKKKEEIVKQREKVVSSKDEIEVKNNTFQGNLIGRSGSKQKKIETQAKSPILKTEPRKIPLIPRKDQRKPLTTASARAENEKISVIKECQTVKVQSNLERIKKNKEEKEKRNEQNIFKHKRTNSNVKEIKGPVKVFRNCLNSEKVSGTQTPIIDNLTGRSEILGFDNEISINSPLMSSEIVGTKDFNDDFFRDENEEEEEKKNEEMNFFGKMPTFQANNHAATLQLISFINEHNLTEDSADKLLKIFSMGPKIS